MVTISSGIAQGKAGWDSLPILADALEDAGCDDAAILGHLREEVRHRTRPLTDRHTVNWDEPTHMPGVFPNLGGGCWQGTCWVVQAILQGPQRIVARYWVNGPDDAIIQRESPVVNPGDREGRAWLVTPHTWIGGPDYVVEARHPLDAESRFVDDDDFGKDFRISGDAMADYTTPGTWGEDPHPDEYSCNFTDGGHPYDPDQFTVEGDDERDVPFACKYVGPGLPHAGVRPVRYAFFGPCQHCKKDAYPLTRFLPLLRVCSVRCSVRKHIDDVKKRESDDAEEDD